MSAMDVVKAGLNAVEQGDFKKVEEDTADDFVFSGPVPQPVGKREFIGLQVALHKAFPDWKFNATDWSEQGDVVTATTQITGTHSGELNLPMPGFSPVAATGKKISLAKQKTTFTVKAGKLARLETPGSPEVGVSGILAQLGVKMGM